MAWSWLASNATAVAALIAFCGVIVATLANLYWNFHSAREARKQPFLKVQLDACLRASRAAAQLASGRPEDIRKGAARDFWQLYWGELAVVENQEVADQMVNFGELLKQIEAGEKVPQRILKNASLDLSYAIRDLVLDSWNIELPALTRPAATSSTAAGEQAPGPTSAPSAGP